MLGHACMAYVRDEIPCVVWIGFKSVLACESVKGK